MYLVIHLTTGRVLKRYNAAGWARRYVDKLVDADRGAVGRTRWYTYESLAVMTDSEYMKRLDEIDPHVEVINMMSKKPVLIRKSDVGTCCDPSTETYWSM